MKSKRVIMIDVANTPTTFAQRYLSTYYSFDYRPNKAELIYNTNTAWYYKVIVTAFLKTKDKREVIGMLIIKDPNKSDNFEVVFEIFERGFNVRYPKIKGKGCRK